MKINKNFACIGGDLRSVYLANALFEEGYPIAVTGIKHDDLKIPITTDISEAIRNADVLLFPLPMLQQNGQINTPFAGMNIHFTEILPNIQNNQIVLGGKISQSVQNELNANGIEYKDYFEREDLTVTNAMLTAEGAIYTLQQIYKDALCQSNVLILGYGRIAKFLAKIIAGYGAKITVAARSPEAKSWIESMGYNYMNIFDSNGYTESINVIFNTVPHLVLDTLRLQKLKNTCIIVDLASAPGGVDFIAAEKLGIQTIHALSLPGKSAPYAAAKAIKNAVFSILEELEV